MTNDNKYLGAQSATEPEANAHLIAAAPEMYEALKAMLAQFNAIANHQHKLLVEGQTLESASANWDEATLGLSIDFEPVMKAIAKAEGK